MASARRRKVAPEDHERISDPVQLFYLLSRQTVEPGLAFPGQPDAGVIPLRVARDRETVRDTPAMDDGPRTPPPGHCREPLPVGNAYHLPPASDRWRGRIPIRSAGHRPGGAVSPCEAGR